MLFPPIIWKIDRKHRLMNVWKMNAWVPFSVPMLAKLVMASASVQRRLFGTRAWKSKYIVCIYIYIYSYVYAWMMNACVTLCSVPMLAKLVSLSWLLRVYRACFLNMGVERQI